MEHKKTVVRLLTALLLILLTALLPFLIALCQDLTTLGTPALGQIQTVELDFGRGISGLGLLTLMDQGNETRWQVIDPAAASMTMEEAESTARTALEPYYEAGLIPGSLPFHVRTAETRVVSIPSGLTGVVWVFTFAMEEKGDAFCEVNLTMDDASGRIIHFGYGCEEQIPAKGIEEKLKSFAAVYFGQLGIPEHTRSEVDDLLGTYIGETAVAQRYRFADEQYGESCVDLYMYQYGFFTDFNG